ncbi:hypothetical protein EV122DRAFT_212329 [Schizophyllum commune]
MSTNTDQIYSPLTAIDVHALKYIAMQTAVDLVLYGVQTALSVAAVTILARRYERSRFTLAAILGLLLSSTTYVVSNKIYYVVQLPVAFGTSERAIHMLLRRLDILGGVAKSLNLVLSDAVLVWRAWRLCGQRRLVKVILSICMIGSVAGATVESVWIYWPAAPRDSTSIESNGQFFVRWIPLLVTNIVATALIGSKVWYCRREIKGYLGFFAQGPSTETVLTLLLESGVAYILYWVVDCILGLVVVKGAFSDVAIFTNTFNHISGIYPTCVLFAVARGTTESLLSEQISQAMRFGSPPGAHEDSCDVDMSLDFQLDDSVGALDSVAQDSRTAELAGPSGTHRGESILASSEGIIEVDRQSTVT